MSDLVEELAQHRIPDPSSIDPFVIGPVTLAKGPEAGELSGLRFAVKDLYDVAGTRTGAGNPVRLERAPVAIAHARTVQALVDAGAELVGKTVTDELALSLSGTNIHYGTPQNPVAANRVPGGSSSGSVAAVAAGLVDFALGTDTGGSTRVPASYCGVFGLRVTHGRLSREGVFILAPSFCSVGIFSRDAATLSRVWAVLAAAAEVEIAAAPRVAKRLLISNELFALADEEAVPQLLAAASDFALASGLELSVAPAGALGDPMEVLSTFRIIQLYEAWQLHGAWVNEHHDALGWGIAARFDAASAVDAESVALARARRSEFQAVFADLLGGDTYLLQPAASGPAPLINLDSKEKDDLRLRTMELTAPAGLAGAPVVSMPLVSVSGLPVGLALVGLPGDDEEVVRLAASLR